MKYVFQEQMFEDQGRNQCANENIQFTTVHFKKTPMRFSRCKFYTHSSSNLFQLSKGIHLSIGHNSDISQWKKHTFDFVWKTEFKNCESWNIPLDCWESPSHSEVRKGMQLSNQQILTRSKCNLGREKLAANEKV